MREREEKSENLKQIFGFSARLMPHLRLVNNLDNLWPVSVDDSLSTYKGALNGKNDPTRLL